MEKISVTTHKIKDNVYCFRGLDRDHKDFHGPVFRTTDGSSYMAYLVIDEEITLIDTIDRDSLGEFKIELLKLLDGRKVDNIIINHVEPDHSAGYEDVKELFPNAKSFCSSKALVPMKNIFFGAHEYTTVKDFDELKTGKYTFTFITTPFIHWPDNMITYLKEERILFSNDAFGNLVTGEALYDDEYNYEKEIFRHAKEYYANILMPCSVFVQRKLKEITEMNLEFDLVCPSHGIIWRKNINKIFDQYMEWASYSNIKNKVVMIYDTIWDSTKEMTEEIAKGLRDSGVEVKIYRAMDSRPSEIMADIMDAKGFLIGSGNFNNTMIPTISDILERIAGLGPRGKKAMAYGSFGWAPVHLKTIEERLTKYKVEIVKSPLYEKYKLKEETKKTAVDIGKEFAALIQ